jgi:hypothetical protein
MMVCLPLMLSHASSREAFVRHDQSADISQQSNRADRAKHESLPRCASRGRCAKLRQTRRGPDRSWQRCRRCIRLVSSRDRTRTAIPTSARRQGCRQTARSSPRARRHSRCAKSLGWRQSRGGGLGRACAHGAADLTDREAATAWGRGRPCTHHDSGSVGQTFRLKQHQEGNGNAPDHWSCGIYGHSFYRCASSRPGLSLLSARPAMGLPGQL